MSKIIDLTQNRPVSIGVVDEDGDLLLTVHTKRRLNRQQAMETTKKVGKGKTLRDVADLEALYRKTVNFLVLPVGRQFKIELKGGETPVIGSETEDVEVRDDGQISALLLALPTETANQVDEELFGMSFIGEDRGNA